jgi:hypothetical protein
VIPTRERALYLRSAIHSAVVAADNAGCPVEIVVSDNDSSDDTAKVIAGFSDPRIISVRSVRRLSMRAHFEFALSHTTGSYITFIGDDDAILPNGLRLLYHLISTHDPDIVKWRVLNYFWPDHTNKTEGRLKLRPHKLNGQLHQLNPKIILENFSQARHGSYQDGGMIYHGCTSRRLIERVQSRLTGPYFRGSSPDVFTSLQALFVTDRPVLKIDLPVTLGGASPKSNGASGQKNAASGAAAEGTEFGKFVAETEGDPWQFSLPVRCPSIDMITLDCLQNAARLYDKKLNINKTAWSDRIAKEIDGFVISIRHDCADMARILIGPTFKTAKEHSAPPIKSFEPTIRSDEINNAVLKRSALKLVYTGGVGMNDAAAAADLLDRLLYLSGADGKAISIIKVFKNIYQIHVRAKLA